MTEANARVHVYAKSVISPGHLAADLTRAQSDANKLASPFFVSRVEWSPAVGSLTVLALPNG